LRRLLLVLVLAGCGSPGVQSDWERANRKAEPAEEQVTLPAYPTAANLLEFGVVDADGFRFFVDGTTLSVGKDGIVRYVLVARSPDGVQNVTYEGLRCASGEQRIYAFGRPDGSWSASRSGWRSLDAPAVQRRHGILYREYFCPQNEPIRSAAEGVRALQQGGHPFSRGFAAPGPVNPR
jgi:hypothetical protein